jgi:hypothetical protein
MFTHARMASSGIAPLRTLVNRLPLTEETVRQAKRVARRCVIMKNDHAAHNFAQLGFEPVQSSHVSYGIYRK